MQISDAQLVKDCRRGDETAWETLVRRYQKLIYAIPRRAGLSEDQSSEVFQEVFTTLFSKLEDIQDPDRLHAWLVTTARRKTWRVISKEKSWQQFNSNGDEDDDVFDEVANIADESLLPDEALVQLEERHRIRTAVSELDDRCRHLIELLFYKSTQPAYAEIAQSLAIPEGSIGPTRARCLQKMLRLLGRS
jgi:RNA polymerase sigma factor (sigma-70 family)